MSTFWILAVEFFAMAIAAISLEFVRRHPRLFWDGAQSSTERLAIMTWMPNGPQAWYLVAPPYVAGEEADTAMGSTAADAPDAVPMSDRAAAALSAAGMDATA